MNHHAVFLALLSAALFAVSTPAARSLLDAIEPTILGGLLYCGAGVGVTLLRRVARRSAEEPRPCHRARQDGDVYSIADEPFEKMTAFKEELVVVSAADLPAIDKPGSLPLAMVAFEHGCPHRKRLEAWYQRHGAMPERTIELGSYHAMLGCVVVGMGIALMPKSVLTTFPESKRLKVDALPPGENCAETVLIWRKGAGSPKIQALQQILGGFQVPIRAAPKRKS